MSIISLNNSFDIKHLQTVCNNTAPNILGNYFHKQGKLINLDFALLRREQGKNRYYETIISHVKNLGVTEQEQLLFECKIITFFTKNEKLGQNYLCSPNRSDKGSFKFLLYCLREINKENTVFFAKLGLFERVIYILMNFRKEFYEAYSLLAHFEFNKIRDTKIPLDPKAILRDLINNQKFAITVKTGSRIEGFYINRLSLINITADNSEVSLNAKHMWKNNAKDETNNFCKLLELYNIKNPNNYLVKEIEIIAIVNIPTTSKKFGKCFVINQQGQTSLGFETLEEEIKQCFKGYYIAKPAKRLDSFFFTARKSSSKFIFKDWV